MSTAFYFNRIMYGKGENHQLILSLHWVAVTVTVAVVVACVCVSLMMVLTNAIHNNVQKKAETKKDVFPI